MSDIVVKLRQSAGALINGTIEDGSVEVAMLDEAAYEIERLRAALNPFGEIAARLGWSDLPDEDSLLDEHLLEARADDIAPGAAFCLMVSPFRNAARVLGKTAFNWIPFDEKKTKSTITPALDAAIQNEIEHGPKDIMK